MESGLKRDRVLNASVAIHFPGLNGVEMPDNCTSLLKELRLDPPKCRYFRHRRLNFILIVSGAGLQHGFLPIPLPRKPKPRVRLRIDWALYLRVFPAAPAVRRDFDPSNCAPTRPRQARNFIKARARQFLRAGWPCDHGLRPELRLEPSRFAVDPQTGIFRRFPHRHHWLVHKFN